MSLFKSFGRKLAAFSSIAATACAAPAAEPKPASPALWKVADSDTTIYLFGTIHLLPPGTQWRSPAFERAATGADTLVVESVFDEKHPETALSALFKLAMTPGLPPLSARIPAGNKAALDKAIAKSGIPAQALDRMETWAAAFLLLSVQFKDLGLDPESGVESTLKKQFEDASKPIGQLETNAEQLGFLDTLSEESQRSFLLAVVEDASSMKDEFDQMLTAWTSGNVKEIARSFNSDLANAPELKDHLLVRRNANWAKWVRGRLAQPGTVLVAVGAGHLAGDQSVVSFLKKDGIKVTRIQ